MNIKSLFRNSEPKKLNATTRRAAIPVPEDYDTEEPNVRLSRAFIVVMLLHVVAVGGIFAFSSLKKNTAALPETAENVPAPKSESPALGNQNYLIRESDTVGSIASAFGLTRQDLEKANQRKDLSALRTGDILVIPAKSGSQPVPLDVQKLLQLSQQKVSSPAVKENVKAPVKVAPPAPGNSPTAEKIYVVQKGDNPVAIAKKIGIKYADLLEANKITDPKKLQIGQKLVIPQK